MKFILSTVIICLTIGTAKAQISEYDTLGYYVYTATFEKAEYIKETDLTGYWTFTFRSEEGVSYTFETYYPGFESNLLANKGAAGATDNAINIGKKFRVVYYDMVEYVWYDEDSYWWDFSYEYDDVFYYNAGVTATFAE